MLEGKIKLTSEFGRSSQKLVLPGEDIDRLETEVHEGLTEGSRGFLRAAAAIKKIHSEKLYRKFADTFEEYCLIRLGKSRSAVYQQLQKLAIAESTGIKTNVQPAVHGFVDYEALTEPNPVSKQVEVTVIPPKPAPKVRMDRVDTYAVNSFDAALDVLMVKVKRAAKEDLDFRSAIMKVTEDYGY